MENIGFSFILEKTFQFFKNNINISILFPFILFLLFFPMDTFLYYHDEIKDIICNFRYSEILIYSFSFFEILIFLPFLILIFLLMIKIADYIMEKIKEKNLNFDFSDFNIFTDIKNKLNIAFYLAIFIIIFFIVILALQFLVFIILYTFYYILSTGNIDEIYKILIYLLPLTFSVLVLALFIYLILPILRKLLMVKNLPEFLNSLKFIFSLKFIRISFTYEYFIYWLEWISSLSFFILPVLAIKTVIIGLIANYINENISYFINLFVNMFLLMVFSIYTAIYSIFVEDKLEVPNFLEEENE